MLLPVLFFIQALFPSSHAQGPAREELIQQLQQDAGVELVESGSMGSDFAPFDLDLLNYLYSYFTTSARSKSPIRLHATRETGARKIWREDQDRAHIDLYFARNAGAGLFTKNQSAPREKEGALFNTTEITVEYNNDLYLQLTDALYSISNLNQILLERYRITTDCKGVEDPCDSFKKGELVTILGILEDLPPHLISNLKLHRLQRFPDGVSTILAINAVADYGNGVIRVTSRAFDSPADHTGEGTLIHEIGHAVWPSLPYDLRLAFESLSWTRNTKSGKPEVKSTEHLFISEYSTTQIEEDFAEHFSAFLSQPELLRNLAPGKSEWLKKNVFIDTEYFTSGDGRTRIFVPSKTPDSTPPRLLKDIESSIEISNEVENSKKTRLRIRITGVVDNLSGLKQIDFEFQSRDPEFLDQIQMRFKIDASTARQTAPDEYLLEEELNRKDLPDEPVFLRMVGLKDHAGNFTYLTTRDDALSFELHGTASPRDARRISASFENERQRKLRQEITANLKPLRAHVKLASREPPGTYLLHLPSEIDSQKVKLQSADITFYGVNEVRIGDWENISRNYEEQMTYHLDRSALDQGRSDAGFDLILDLRRGVNIKRLLMTSISLHYRSLSWSIELLDSDEKNILEPGSIGTDPTPAEIELNGIELELLPDERQKGNLILKSKLPLRGFENGGKVRISYQTPSGKTVFGETIELKPGQTDGTIEIELDRFREQGEYQIREIEIMENSPEGTNPAIHEGKQYRVQKVASRGIRKTIVVQKATPAI